MAKRIASAWTRQPATATSTPSDVPATSHPLSNPYSSSGSGGGSGGSGSGSIGRNSSKPYSNSSNQSLFPSIGPGNGGSPFPPLAFAVFSSTDSATEARTPLSNSTLANTNGSSSGRSIADIMGARDGHSHHSHHVHDAAASGSGMASPGLPPAPSKFDVSLAQQSRLQDAYWSEDEEDMDCPLCLEEIDLSDANFKPCPCGYQICRFCWHHIKQNLNGRCPACRRKYSDQTVEFTPMSSEEIKRLTQAKKQKEREKKELEQMNRKHLANMRVVQKNLVYVTGLSSKLAKEELIPTLRSQEYFGQYGRISKILISRRTTASKLVMGTQESAIGVYVTYYRKEDAARAIVAIDGTKGSDGKVIRASYGTTKYCTTYLRNLPCTNPACTYLHEPGEEADSFTKEDLSTLRHAAKDSERKPRPPLNSSFASERKNSVSSSNNDHTTSSAISTGSGQGSAAGVASETTEASALPKTASWATSGALKPLTNGVTTPTGLREQDLPPLSAAIPPPPQLPAAPTPSKRAQLRKEREQRAAAAAAAAATAAALASSKAQDAAPTPAPAPAATAAPASTPAVASLPVDLPAKPTVTVPARPPGLGPHSPVRDTPSPAETVRETGTGSKVSPKASPAKLPRPREPARMASAGPPPGLAAPSAPSSNANANANAVAASSTASTEQAGSAAPADAAPADKDEENSDSARRPAYQPSQKAQALIDDLQQRRSAPAQPSPFPDLDEIVLGSFAKGEFSFNLPATLATADTVGTGTALPAFSSFPQNGSAYAASGFSPAGVFGALGSPGLGGNAVLTQGYRGSFDPFASSEEGGTSKPHGSPFAAIDEMKRNLSDERANGSDDEKSNGEQGKRGSRFSFTKRRDDQGSSASFGTAALNNSLPSLTSASSAASSPAVGTSTPRADSFTSAAGSSNYDASTLSRNFMSSILGLKSDSAGTQDSSPVGSVLSNGRPDSSGSVNGYRSTGPNVQQVANGTRSWQEQQAAHAQQQHAAARKAAYPQHEQPREHQQPLLAQLMASASQRRAENNMHMYGQAQQQQGHFNAGLNGQLPFPAEDARLMHSSPADMPFYDPSIMSIARGPQQQQQQQHLNPYRHNMPGAGGYDFHGPPGFGPRPHNQRPHERTFFLS